MKKYKQVMAALLAMNLTVYVMPTGVVKISANVESQSNEDTIKKAQAESSVLEISDIADAGITEDTDLTADSEAEISDSTENSDDQTSDTSNSEVEVSDDATDDNADISESEISDETETPSSEEQEDELFSDGTQSETADSADEQEDGTAVQAGEVRIKASDLTLERFKHYSNGTMSIEAGEELILLSYCDPNKLKNITIQFSKSAECDLTKKISEETDLTAYLYDTAQSTANADIQNEEPSLDSNSLQNETVNEAEEENETIATDTVNDTTEMEATTDLSEQEDNTADTDDTTQDDTTTQKIIAGQEFSFQGLGSEGIPFEGTIDGITPSKLSINRSFFNGLSSKTKFKLSPTLRLTWLGDATEPMVAKVYRFDDSGEYELPVRVITDDKNPGIMGSLIDTVTALDGIAAGTLTIGKRTTGTDAEEQITYGTNVKSEYKGNAGLICNTLDKGTICLDEYTFPSTYTVTSTDRNAGGVIGMMKTGTKLEIKEPSTITPTITAKINAGGLVGEMESGTELVVDEDITVSNPMIEGDDTAGGVAGKADGATFSGTGKIKINGSEEEFGSSSLIKGLKVGGVVGYYIVNDTGKEQSMPENIEVEKPHLTIRNGNTDNSANGGNAGGYFGLLELKENAIYKIGSSANKTFDTYYEYGPGYAYGGLIGRVTSESIGASLCIQNITINSYFDNRIRYHGGVVGELGIKGDEKKASYLEVSGVKVTVYNPFGVSESDPGFGGIVGRLGEKSILKARDITVSTDYKVGKNATNQDNHIWEGGGIVGGASSGSVIELSGLTDLTGVHYVGRFCTGQLVGMQEDALVYARGDGNGAGWTFKRGKLYADEIRSNCSTWKVNDIGNYGEIIRLKADEATTGLSSDLITITDSHEVVLKSLATDWSGDITISSTEEFALLSIAINSRGAFWADTKNPLTYKELLSKNITFKSGITVDLTGTGILGLTRDNSGEETYSGNLDGSGSTIILDTGTEFGSREDKKATEHGSGKLYVYKNGNCHNSQGIFAKASGNISKLTVRGSVALTSDRGDSDREIRIGGIAAQSVAPTTTTKKKTINNVVVDELKITAEVSDSTNNFTSFSIGGIYGDDFGSQELYIQGSSEIKPQIEVKQTDASLDTKIYAGGILGQVSGSSFKLRCESVTVGGSITSDVSQYAYIGGLVGVIQNKDGNRWIEIADLTCDGLKIKAPNATEACGGLFGAIWANVHVYFENKNNSKVTKLTVSGDSSISAPKAASVGGLAYHSSGLWEIQDKGIDMQQLSINAKEDVGLLVCRGENKEKELIGGSENNIGALYLRTTAYWSTAYKLDENNVTVEGNSGVFDEFVAHTANTAAEITDNNKNGVISLATSDRVGVDKNSAKCTTYVNRTAYGKNHKTNGCSRYYYDLDKYIKDAYDATDTKDNGYIDTEQELLLWSVERYAYSNIKKYFYSVDEDEKQTVLECKECYTIGPESGYKNFDMQGYSYYPINLYTNMVVRNSTFTFYNQDIEDAEKSADNKKTRGNESGDSDHSQHYTMHCGLFFHDRATKDTKSITTTVYNVTFKGSIGRLSSAGGSGALFAGMVNGSIDNNVVYTATVKVTGSGITLDGLKVTDYDTEGGYAPLLINRIRDYTTLDVSGGITASLKTEESQGGYDAGTQVASSLIGNVGTNEDNNGSKQMNLSFSNIKVPDMSTGSGQGIFSHATLLESFQYGGSSVATYNFYQEDDYAADGTTYDHHKVTYGREISETLEYPDLQKWYYNEENYGKDTRLVRIDGDSSKTNFSSYLPYVYTSYNSGTLSHEIKVNQRVAEITNGCGTYTHPYVITTDREMNIIAEFLATGNARKDWRIRIIKDQTAVCSKNDEEDVILQYGVNDETNWREVQNQKTEDNKDNWVPVENGITIEDTDVIHNYLLNAYYDIQGENGKLTLKDFAGFGTSVNPFRGVITSENNVKLTLEGAGTCRGLIPYSYGSVIRNIEIFYEGEGITLTKNTTANTASDYFPDACFGGVIGCVLGGDNIIEGVTVTVKEQWLTLTGSKKHLIQVGGYVGSVCGGGVIFRGMTDSTGLSDGALISGSVSTNEKGRLYVNPYVGRVLDGFVFNESSITLNNTDRNYKINPLNSGKYITATAGKENSFEINGSQGLMILSAIVNSGAASGGVSNAYKTETESTEKYKFGNNSYGKVRNADYDCIGDVTEANKDGDFAIAKADDRMSPSENNVPYLIKEYCDASAFDIANPNKNITINLNSTGDCDMIQYGTAYQGIAARYVTNAVLSEKINTPKGLIPRLAGFNGNDVNVIVDMRVREYEDDDFHAASVGGMFNLLDVVSGAELKKLTVKSTKTTATPSKGVSLTYYASDGSERTEASSEWLFKNRYGNTHQDNEGRQYSFKESVGVGGFAGSTTSVSASDNNTSVGVKFENLNLESMTVAGPVSSGGLLGNAGRAAIEAIGDEENNTQLYRYSDTEIPIKDIAILMQPNKGVSSVAVNIINCSYNNLAVTASKAAGGFVGYVDGISDVTSSLNISGTTSKNVAYNVSEIGNTDNSTLYAGGIFGYTKTNINMNADENAGIAILQNIKVSAKKYAGGVIGFVNGSKQYQIKNMKVEGNSTNRANVSAIYANNQYISAGGIIGEAIGGSDNSIDNCYFENADINNSTNFALNQEGQRNGGIIGYVRSGPITISGCTVQTANVYGSRSGGIAGGVAAKTVIKNSKVLGTADKSGSIKGTKIAGGVIGISSVKDGAVRLEGCRVKYMQMASNEWGAGGMIGDVDYNAHKELYLFDDAVENSQIEGTVAGATAGGLSGTVRAKMTASNILLSDVSITNKNTSDTNKVGILIGVTGDKDLGIISVAGLSLQNVTAIKKDNTPVTELYGVANGNKANVKKNSYFAFADYLGVSCTAEEEETGEEGNASEGESESTPEEEKLSAGKENLLGAEGSFPYVVTSPKSSLTVSETENDDEKFLYGDGTSWTSDVTDGTTTFTVNAQQIFVNRNQTKDGHYAYSNTGVSDDEVDFSTLISTYKKNQATTNAADFPVLQITAGDTGTITKYLDILTNGGFSQANSLNTSSSVHVTADTAVYQHNGKKFIKNNTEESALKVSTNSSKQISFSTTTNYDNDKDRFTLLTVTFTETDETGKVTHAYNVQIPVIVRRMLEMDFSATLSYGTNFRSSAYEGLTHHVLESFGSSITGYLTYTYNSAENEYTDYGWQSYIDAGGNVASAMEKAIDFKMDATLPKGTQMSLVDCSSGKVYYYTATGQEKNSISLSSFIASDGKSYEAPSIGEVMGATVDSTGGPFIKVDENGKPEGGEEGKEYSRPTVRIKNGTGYEYYRLATTGESGTCTITVDESKLHKTEPDPKDSTKTVTVSDVSENYYLVINVPKGSSEQILNGSIQTTVTSTIPHQIHYRTIGKGDDDHDETASTYLISSGYTQKLEEKNITEVSKKVSEAEALLKVDVVDEITFPKGQVYADYDKLYQRFVGGLQKTVNGSSTSEQFPKESTGIAEFYVYTISTAADGKETTNYYKYEGGEWKDTEDGDVAVSYRWTSDGGNMEVPLSTDGKLKNAISLDAIRKKVKGSETTGYGKIYVELKMDVSIQTAGIKDVIPESDDKGGEPTDYTKLVYYSQLSTETQSLIYSTNRASKMDTRTKYYREEPTGAKLTYEADLDKIGQLGINLLDLDHQYLDDSKKYSLIDTNARYELSEMKNLDTALRDSNGIKFTLSLMPKNTKASDGAKLEDYQAPVSDADEYLEVVLKSKDSGNVNYSNGVWSWTVPQSTYWADNNIKTTKDVFDGSTLTQDIQLKVRIDNVENTGVDHYYSNYRVVLTAEILDKNDSPMAGTHLTDNIIYTLAKIKPEFVG